MRRLCATLSTCRRARAHSCAGSFASRFVDICRISSWVSRLWRKEALRRNALHAGVGLCAYETSGGSEVIELLLSISSRRARISPILGGSELSTFNERSSREMRVS